jgi:benzoate transport
MPATDPRDLLSSAPMSRLQIIAVALCIGLNALDGFDVLSISFAAPGIASDWGIDRAALGVVLSMELVGMAIGSLLLGRLADAIGRRPTILACLSIMTAGMFLASTAPGVEVLSAYRFVTGLGIGGILAAINAMTAEYSNAKRKNLCVTLMAGGYPMGAIIGGSAASALLASFDWRMVFIFGGFATLMFVPLVWSFLPESIDYLAQKRPEGALQRINATLKRMGHPEVAEMPPVKATPKAGVARLFASDLAMRTTLLTIIYFAHILTFYFIIKWIPKIVVDMGFPAPLAASVLVWASVGGATGAVLLGLLSQRYSVRKLVFACFLCGAAMVAVFGAGQRDLAQLSLIAGIAGFFTNAAIVGLYALFAEAFPTEVRAGGTGFVIGVGRGGAALAPMIAGFLFAAGYGLQFVAIMMSAGSLVAAVALTMFARAGGAPIAAPRSATAPGE